MNDTPRDRLDPIVVMACLDALRCRPSGIFSDIDGTISAIAATPGEAVVAPAARRALERLCRRLDLVAVVTGRSAVDGEQMVGLSCATYVGNHGMERHRGSERWIHPTAAVSSQAIGCALSEVSAEAIVAGITDGLLFENKQLSASVHYRLSPAPAAIRDRLLPIMDAAAARYGLKVAEGRLVIELRPRVAVTKGTAMVDLIDQHQLRGVVYVGDDLTDVDAMDTLRELRAIGKVAGVGVAVVGLETHDRVRNAADATVNGVSACIALLSVIADVLDTEPRPHGRAEPG